MGDRRQTTRRMRGQMRGKGNGHNILKKKRSHQCIRERIEKNSNNKIKMFVDGIGRFTTPSLAMQQRQLRQQAQARPRLSTPLVFVNIVHSKGPLQKRPCMSTTSVRSPEITYRI